MQVVTYSQDFSRKPIWMADASVVEGTGAEASKIATLSDLDLRGKTVFIRIDFNVPLRGPDKDGHFEVADDSRIVEALPTIQHAMNQGAKVILASHLGRPKGKKNASLSLLPVAECLAQHIDGEITLADDCVGDGIDMMVQSLQMGQAILLENLRYHNGEEANDSNFVQRLARYIDVYVTDAFGTAHRKHASTYGLPDVVEEKGIGFLIEKEITFLDRLMRNPPSPFYAILGGSKVSDKIKTIDSLLRQVDGLLIGGAMAHAFTLAEGGSIPKDAKQPSAADVEAAKQILAHAKKREIPLLIPVDTVDGFDIGPKTITKFTQFIADAKTLFWNGPVGWFEKDEYAVGSNQVARAVAQLDALTICGGGDTIAAVKKAGVADQIDHLSTGGGAVLKYLEGAGLPGLNVLRVDPKKQRKADFLEPEIDENELN